MTRRSLLRLLACLPLAVQRGVTTVASEPRFAPWILKLDEATGLFEKVWK